MSKTKTTFWLCAMVTAALLVTLAGCVSKTNTEDPAIRPANEASQEASNETAAVTPTPGTTASSRGGACDFTRPEWASSIRQQQILMGYFEALNAQDYTTAYAYLAPESQAKYGSQAAFASQMGGKFKCVQVTGFTDLPQGGKCPMVSASLGMQCYTVTLEAFTPSGEQTVTPNVSLDYRVVSDPHGDLSTAPAGQVEEL